MADVRAPQPSAPAGPGPVACPSCGKANPAGFRFCGACGGPLERTCPACGQANPAAFRFCGNCAGPLDAVVPVAAAADEELAERKVVTVLFADLTASTELASSLDPEDLRGILTAFFEPMAEEIERFGGTVEKFIGDAIVAVFGVPAAHEDDPERAVRAALAMHGRLAELNAKRRAAGDPELAMRVGINTGEVVTATGIDREALITGEPVNLAARLETLASPGATVVGGRTQRDTRHAIAYRSLGEVRVKGIDHPVEAWEVAGEIERAPDGVTTVAPAAAPMVGRDSEMDLLRLVLGRAVREGRPALVSVLGPAGIGKSRLSHEFVGLVRREHPGARVVRGRCLPYGSGLTYWPMAEILKADAGILDSDPPEAILEKAAARLGARFAQEDPGRGTAQVLLSSIGVPVQPDPIAGATPDVARELIARSWRAYFEALAADRPVVALVEDLHWADPMLLDLVESLAGRVGAPVVFLAMARPDLWDRRPAWAGGLRNATTIELSPLSEADSEDLVRHLLGGAGAPPEAVGPVLERAEGNPFFAQELLRMLVEDGHLVRENGSWRLVRGLTASLPDTVQGVIASRIDLLPPAEKRAIQDAAVVGRVFWQGALARLGSSGAAGAVDGLVAKGLAWEQEGSTIEGERQLIFNHVLTRDVAYQGIPKTRRAQAHGQALAWIEEVTRGRDEEFAEILAYHAELAGDTERTARYALLAGHRSRRVFAALEAIRWYDRAAGAAAGLGEGGRPFVAEIALARGEAREQLGEFPDAERDYALAVDSARAEGNRPHEARALSALAHILWLQDRYEDGERVLAEALERTREVGAKGVLSRLLYTAGTMAFGQGRYADSLARHEEALAVAREEGDLEGEAWARHGLCECRYFLGPYEEGLADGLEADRLLRQIGQRPMVYHNAYMIGFLLWHLGRLGEAIEVGEESLTGTRELGDRRNEAFAMVMRYQAEVSRGRLGRALEIAEEQVAIARSVQSPRLEVGTLTFHAELLIELGRFDRARQDAERALELSDAIRSTFSRGRVVAILGAVALHDGEEDSARQAFQEARRIAHGILTEGLFAGRVEARAWAEAGRTDDLARAAGELVALAEAESPPFLAWGRWGLGLAALHRGAAGEAIELGRSALEIADATGERPLEWRAHHLLAGAYDRAGRTEDARRHRARAAELVRSLAESLGHEEDRAAFMARPGVPDALESA